MVIDEGESIVHGGMAGYTLASDWWADWYWIRLPWFARRPFLSFGGYRELCGWCWLYLAWEARRDGQPQSLLVWKQEMVKCRKV